MAYPVTIYHNINNITGTIANPHATVRTDRLRQSNKFTVNITTTRESGQIALA
jgi:hypothetical protein